MLEERQYPGRGATDALPKHWASSGQVWHRVVELGTKYWNEPGGHTWHWPSEVCCSPGTHSRTDAVKFSGLSKKLMLLPKEGRPEIANWRGAFDPGCVIIVKFLNM